jgi:CRP-like cAMP-binding protein
MEDLESILQKHSFLAGLKPEHVKLIVGCAKNLRFRPDEFLAREGQKEACMYLIRRGTVAIEAHAPNGERTCIETLMPGDVLGISWVTPATAHFDCRARETVLAFSLDHECLLRKMSEDPEFGYALTSRLLDNTYQRLSRLRLQQLDVYR